MADYYFGIHIKQINLVYAQKSMWKAKLCKNLELVFYVLKKTFFFDFQSTPAIIVQRCQ